MIETLTEYEKVFALNNCHGDILKDTLFEFDDCKSHVIFSAPHSVRTIINGKERFSDKYTGAIATYLKNNSEFSTIIRKKFIPEEISIADFVAKHNLENHFYLDVHGMRADAEFALAIGTGYLEEKDYAKQLHIIENLADKYDIRYVINHVSYQGKVGFTGKYQERYGKASILQLEWRKDMRDFINFSENVLEKTIPFLIELAQEIEKI